MKTTFYEQISAVFWVTAPVDSASKEWEDVALYVSHVHVQHSNHNSFKKKKKFFQEKKHFLDSTVEV